MLSLLQNFDSGLDCYSHRACVLQTNLGSPSTEMHDSPVATPSARNPTKGRAPPTVAGTPTVLSAAVPINVYSGFFLKTDATEMHHRHQGREFCASSSAGSVRTASRLRSECEDVIKLMYNQEVRTQTKYRHVDSATVSVSYRDSFNCMYRDTDGPSLLNWEGSAMEH